MNLFSNLTKDDEEPMTQENLGSVVDKVNDYFKTPISYNKDKVELKENIATD